MVWANTNRTNGVVGWWLSGLVAVALVGLLVKPLSSVPAGTQTMPATSALERLPVQAQGVISTAVGTGESKFGAQRTSSGYRLAGGGVVANLSHRGVELGASGGSLSLSLTGVGRGSREARLGAGKLTAHGNRVVISRGRVAEWYGAGPLGVEQGFTVARRPAGGGGALTLSLSAAGSLAPRRGATSLEFADPSGRVVLRYGGLSAVDASGRVLSATFVLQRGQLALRVRDQGARYPVRIDPFVQQGSKLTGSGEIGQGGFGWTVALSADGNTALIGGDSDNQYNGAAWVFTRTNGVWSQQAELVGDCTSACTGPNGTGEIGAGQFGRSVALSGDGNTALIGGSADDKLNGAAWVFTRANGIWTQEAKLVGDCVSNCAGNGTGETAAGTFGWSVALSGDGNMAMIGAPFDNSDQGSAWVFTRSNGHWGQFGNKLGAVNEFGTGEFGYSVALSANGDVALAGGLTDNSHAGAAWAFGGSGGINPAGTKLIANCTGAACGGANGTGEVGAGEFGASVALSSDGTTALIGGFYDNNAVGAAWVFTSPGGAWSQQGAKLTGTANGEVGNAFFGWSVALSTDGNSALIGGQYDNNLKGAAWTFTRSGGNWSQQATQLVGNCAGAGCSGPNGTGESGNGWFGQSVALSADAGTALIGASGDVPGGAAWVFGPAQPTPPGPAPTPPPGSGTGPQSGPAPGGNHPSCTLKAKSRRVTVTPHSPRHKPGPATLALIVKCDRNTNGILAGSATELLRKHRTKGFKLRALAAMFHAGSMEILKIRIPAALVLALDHGVKESATFSLAVGGRTVATTKIRSLRL